VPTQVYAGRHLEDRGTAPGLAFAGVRQRHRSSRDTMQDGTRPHDPTLGGLQIFVRPKIFSFGGDSGLSRGGEDSDRVFWRRAHDDLPRAVPGC
jgi:hypothetical protein